MRPSARSCTILLITSCVVCLVLGEVIVALLIPQQTVSVALRNSPRIFCESDLLPYELLPGARSTHTTPEFAVDVEINSLGYRGPEFDPEKGDQFRILVLGDSFTFGHGVASDETYSSVLERTLAAQCAGRQFEVINAGYAACNYPDTYYLYLKNRGCELDPDLVVVGFFVGNDVDRQTLAFHEWVETDSANLPLKIVGSAAHVEDGFWISNRRAARHRLPVVKDSHLAQAICAAVSRKRDCQHGHAYNHEIYRRDYSDRTEGAVARVRRVFSAIKQLTDETGAGLAVLEIPAYEQVYPLHVFGPDGAPAELDLLKPQREFSAFFDSTGILVMDPLPELKQFPLHEGLYFSTDQHWTARGHEVAGQLLAEWLQQTSLVPSATITP